MLVTSAFLLAGPALAQGQAPAQDVGPKVGDVAPDFTLPASTKAGLAKPVHLADLKGQVVVLAFFPKARTSG
jgi:peroxiredoxin Q/BCP